MSTVTRNAKKSELASYLPLAGGTMTGQLNFSGTTHAGIKLLSLTTAERDALTPAVGMVIYNTTTSAYNVYDGAWKAVTIGGVLTDYLPLAGGTMAGNINFSNLTASRVLTTDGSKNGASSSVTTTELGYLSGVTSAIQTQINTINSELDIIAFDQVSIPVAPTAAGDGAIAISASGSTTTASGDRSFAIQGGRATANDAFAFKGLAQAQASMAIGTTNTVAAGVASVAIGDQARASIVCEFAIGGGEHATDGDCQERIFFVRANTTNATPTEMLAGQSGAPTDRIVLTANSAMCFSAKIVAKRTDAAGEAAGYTITGVIRRDSTAASTAIVGSITKTVIGEDAAAWDVTASADTTNAALVFTVTGEAAKTIQWTCVCNATQVTHA